MSAASAALDSSAGSQPAGSPPGGSSAAALHHGTKVTQTRVIRSEWTKLTSLRSTVWTLAGAVILVIGFGAIICAAVAASWDTDFSDVDKLTFDPTAFSLSGLYLAQIAVGALGVLVISGEYSTGMIRASLTAVPKRLPVLWAKALVFGAVTFVMLGAALLIAFLLGQELLSSESEITLATLSGDGVARAIIGAAIYLTVIGLLGMALGALFRSTPAGIGVLFALLLVIPILTNLLPDKYGDPINNVLPSRAGEAVMTVVSTGDQLSVGQGFLSLALWTVGSLAVSAILLTRRDA